MQLELMFGLLVAGATIFALYAGIFAFFLALKLRKRLQFLEKRLLEMQAQARGPLAPTIAGSPAVVLSAPPVQALPPTQVSSPARASAPLRSVPEALRTAPGIAPLPTPQPREMLESFEQLLGTRLLSWVGALVTLVGIAFLLKFLYERGWIGPVGRVAIGLGAGLAVLALGELKVLRVHDLLSQAVSSVGIGTLFLTTYLAYKFYDFGGQVATFALLAWFATFAVTLAVLRRGRVLAVLGYVCAYAVPILLSTGQDQAEVLFSYLAVLGLGSLAVRALRDWWEVTPLCFALSAAYYVGWHESFFTHDRFAIAVAGASGLIVLFGFSSLVRGLSRRCVVAMSDALVLSLSQIGGICFLWVTHTEGPPGTVHRTSLGFMLVGVCLLDQAWIWLLRRQKATGAAIEEILTLLGAGALVLIIPAVLRAEGSVLAWSFAAVLLADMGFRSGSRAYTLAAAVCLPVAVWVGFSEGVQHSGIFWPCVNRVFVAWLAVGVAWLAVGWRVSGCPSPKAGARAGGAPSPSLWLGVAIRIAGLGILLILGTYETYAWFHGQMNLPGVDGLALKEWRTRCLLILHALFPGLWLWRARRQPTLWMVAAAFYAVLGVAYLVNLADLHHRETLLFLNPSFAAGPLLPAGIFLVAQNLRWAGTLERGAIGAALEVYAHVLCVALLSVELHQGLTLKAWEPQGQVWVRLAMVSVGWAVYATVTFWIGIQRGRAVWRWFAMGLLLATLLKVFLVDMAEARQLWRVVSFLVLGTLLMGCSYIYARHEKRKSSASTEGGSKS